MTNISLDDYDEIGIVHEGHHGNYFRIKSKRNDKIYSAFVLLQKINKPELIDQFKSYIQKLMQNKSPSILSIIGYNLQDFDRHNFPTIITNYASKGTLADVLIGKTQLSPEIVNNTKRYINALGIAFAFKYLHNKNIVFGYLTPQKILLDENFYPQLLIFYINSLQKEAPQIIQQKNLGTLNKMYLAPEMSDDLQFTAETDIYAFAVILYQLISGNSSISQNTSHFGIQFGSLSLKNFNEEVSNFFENCLSLNLSDRPDFDSIYEALQKDFFKEAFNEIDEKEVAKYIKMLDKSIDKDEKSASDEERSSSDKEKSDSDKEKSDSDKEKSSSDKEKSSSDEEKSDSDKEKSDSDKEKSDSDKEKSSSDKEKSSSDEEKSDSDKEKNSSDEEKSSSDEEKSSSDEEKSGSEEEKKCIQYITDLNKKTRELQSDNKKLRKKVKKLKSKILKEKQRTKSLKKSKNSDADSNNHINNYQIIKTLGFESTTELYKVSRKKQILALKLYKPEFFLNKDETESKKALHEWSDEEEDEINIDEENLTEFFNLYRKLNDFKYPNVIKSYKFYSDGDCRFPFIIFDYYPRNLKNSINRLDDNDLCLIIYEISKTMALLHQNGLSHLNLKPENVLLDSNKHPILTDFRIKTKIEGENYLYIAPEILKDDDFDEEAADVYSFGILLMYIITRGHFEKFSLSEIFSNSNYVTLPDINEFSNGLIANCTNMQAHERHKFDDITSFIEGYNYQLMDSIDSEVIERNKFKY